MVTSASLVQAVFGTAEGVPSKTYPFLLSLTSAEYRIDSERLARILVWTAASSLPILVVHGTLKKSKTLRRLLRIGQATLPQTEQRHATTPVTSDPDNALNGAGKSSRTPMSNWDVGRLTICLALLSLSIYGITTEKGSLKWLEVVCSAFYAYATLLGLLTIFATRPVATISSTHLTAVLLVAFGLSAYRDIYPLATYTKRPDDAREGWLTWTRIGLLTLAGVIVPLFRPTIVRNLDTSSSAAIDPEHSASWFSYITYNYLTGLVFKANRVEHLPAEELPPLAHTDRSEYLTTQAFPKLESEPRLARMRHIAWQLLYAYRGSYVVMALILAIRVLAELSGPLALNRLLAYLEKGGSGTAVRPWVWISLLFISPAGGSLLYQLYIFFSTRTMVCAEGLIAQLVFTHALRARLRDDPQGSPESNSPSGTSTAVQTPVVEPSELPLDTELETAPINGSSDADDHMKNDSSKRKEDVGSDTTSVASKLKEEESSSSSGKSQILGKITNLVSTDLSNITNGRDFLFIFVQAPIQLSLTTYFLYKLLGWSALVSIAVMVVTLPAPTAIARLFEKAETAKMKKTDARVQTVSDTLGVLRMIKLFGWEKKVEAQIDAKREEELHLQLRVLLLSYLIYMVNNILPFLTMITAFSLYSLVMKRELSASIVFSAIALFDLLKNQLHAIFYTVPSLITAKVSLNRLNEFLNDTELLDRYDVSEDQPGIRALPPTLDPDFVGLRNATFTWTSPVPSTPSTPGTLSRRNFKLQVDGDLVFKRGKINVVLGPTGSGKTSLLMALLGEMHYVPTSIDSYVNLPRSEGVAYAAQEAWILNATIKDNILFGKTYEEERYKKVISQCALERDLAMFDAGDETEIGEKGVTLSGGQKARVSLARAIYSSANILLLDDVLSALDVHTSKWIVDRCFKGDLVKGRTVILVTHNAAMVVPVSDFVVTVAKGGRVSARDNIADALDSDPTLRAEMSSALDIALKEDATVDGPLDGELPQVKDEKKGKLIEKEEINVGRIGRDAFIFFFKTYGGLFFWSWLGYWARQYSLVQDVDVVFYLAVYCGIVFATWLIYYPSSIYYNFGVIRGCREIHRRLTRSVLGTTQRWLDTTPSGRIVSRFTQDIRSVDGMVSQIFGDLVIIAIACVMKLVGVIVYSPIFFFPGACIGYTGLRLGRVYLKATLAVKREQSNARSPVYSHFHSSIAGVVTIRAFGVEEDFKGKSRKLIDHYTRMSRTLYNLNRWISVRMDLLGAIFASSLGAYLVYGKKADASATGFSLTLALSFTSYLLWLVKMGTHFEISANSIERIKGFIEIEQEPKPTEAGLPPAYWPASGSLVVDKLCAKYSEDGPDVLHDISFEVRSGEHVGVVGRTGAGKSSLSLALLRIIPTTGTVLYDGLDIRNVNLDALRTNITIIPQHPELISGTLRQNLDPFEEHDDATLNSCLRSAGLYNLQREDDDDRITLDSAVSGGGSNFSLGQRQIIALARAMVRRSKIYLLDEATASVDNKTDNAIQEAIATEFSDRTLIIVAHRLQTIMAADKILVLDSGKVVEFDSPKTLLAKEEGIFKSLVDGSGDRDALYAMVKDRS